MVYGPTLELFQQQQKLRTYYNFLNVDTVRYRIGGQERMFVSAVRETPLYEPVPWLAYWGQRFMMFTHGFGLVLAPAASVTADGEPTYVSWDIPAKVTYPELAVAEPRVYYGEGSATMAFSNVHGMKELDYPTDQDRAEIVLPRVGEDRRPHRLALEARRLRLAQRQVLGARLLGPDQARNARPLHSARRSTGSRGSRRSSSTTPTRTRWPSTAASCGSSTRMTTTDRYPYSLIEELGDKSDERSPFPRPTRWINYVEDSVKATVDAATGQIKFYKIHDGPVARAWEKVYPTLFSPGDKMPEAVRAQLTYPPQLLHIQFDDLYIYYHMKDPMYFFNMEDMWDDGDEVLGPILDTGKAITFSMEPYACMLEPGNGVLPAAGARRTFSTRWRWCSRPRRRSTCAASRSCTRTRPTTGRSRCSRSRRASTSSGPSRRTPRSTRIP